MFKQPPKELVEWFSRGILDTTKDWILPSGSYKAPRWNNNTGKYEPDPDDH